MADFEVKNVRTIAIVGANGSGKTTLADAMMFAAGAASRQGSVDQGTSLSDTDEEEKARKISIRAIPLNCQFNGKNLFFIDTPGYADFWGEVILALEAVDAVVLVMDGVSGLESQTKRLINAVRRKGLPFCFFVNRLDKEHSRFSAVLDSLAAALDLPVFPVTVPNDDHPGFKAVYRLMGGGEGEAVPSELESRWSGYREKVVEAAAETDDALIEKYLGSGELSVEEIRQGTRKSFIQARVVPVLAGSALGCVGIKELMGTIADLFPSPQDRGVIQMGKDKVEPRSDAPLCAWVFKSITDPFVGQLSYLRIWSGTLRSDSEVHNTVTGKKERISHLYLINGKEQVGISEAIPGYIAALPKLKQTSLGDTLCDSSLELRFPPVELPSPTVVMAVYSKARGDEEKLAQGFHKLVSEDPTLSFRRNEVTNEALITALGDLQIEILLSRLRANFKVDVELRLPRVPYRETIVVSAEGHTKYKKQTGGRGQYAEVYLKLEPRARGEGFEFVDKIVGGAIPKGYLTSVEKGIKGAMRAGVLAGASVVDLRAICYDGSYHEVDSSNIAFEIAGSKAFKDAMEKARPVLLEPIMNVTITVPKEYMGNITGDLNSRRGRISGVEQESGYQVIRAQVPMAEMLRYSTELRSLTGGSGQFRMEFDHHEEVPANIAQKIMQQHQKEKQDE